LVAADFATLVREQVGRCSLAIHLIGKAYGVVPDGASRSLVVLQQELAAERSAASGLARLIWLAPGLEVDDDRQRDFVHHLLTSPDVHAHAELLQVPLEVLKTTIHAQLAAPAAAKTSREAKGGAEDLTRIYLICDQQDLDTVKPLEDFLFGQGYEVTLPLFEEDEAQARSDHEESLATCDAFLLFFGEAGEPWLRRKLRELQKSAALHRDRPLRARGIYVAGPPTPSKERFRTLEAAVLREPAAGFSADVLTPFVSAIEATRV
jgi:hypothetical protein